MSTEHKLSRFRAISALSITGALALASLVATPALAADLTVGPSSAFTTVQEAVDAAEAGDTITIEAGTYSENVFIDKQLTILGANAGVNGNGTRAAESIISSPDEFEAAITATSPVTVDGLEISQATASTSGHNIAVELEPGSEGSVVRNNLMKDAAHGVEVAQSAASGTTTIENNVFIEMNLSGVQSHTSHGLVISGNTISADTSDGAGVILVGTNVNTVISENTITAATGVSSLAKAGAPTTGLNIEKNTIDITGPKFQTAAINLAERNESGSVVSGNKITANGNKYGINFANGLAGASAATDVTIAENTIEGMAWGIALGDVGDNVRVTGNTINALSNGIRSTNTTLNNFEFSGNTITTTDEDSASGNATIYAQSSMSNGKIVDNTLTTKGSKGLTGAVLSDDHATDILIEGNTMSSFAGVISRDSTHMTISGNTTQTTLAAVYLFNAQDGLTVTGNDFGGDKALVVAANNATFTTAPVITGNVFKGTTSAGVNAQAAGLLGQGNYWSNGASLYPAKQGTQDADLSQALPVNPINSDDNTPSNAPSAENAPAAKGNIAAGKLTVDLKGVSALGLAGAAASDYYPYTVEGGEWVKVYFVGAKTWSKWVQSPTTGVVVVDAPAGVDAKQGVIVVNFAGDTIAAVKESSLSFAPAIVTDKLPEGVVGEKYDSTITATGSAPITFSNPKGDLPKGLTLKPATDGTATLTGTPENAGTFNFTLAATNELGTHAREYSVTIAKQTEQLTVCSVPRKIPVFADTPLGHKFYKEIDWMECMKYSTGWRQTTGKPLYKPTDNLQRAAMAAFIFRMEADKNYEAPKVSPFADVKPSDKFYKEIAWMHEKKLSTGWREAAGKPTFRPYESLSREAMAAFIYRLEAPETYTVPTVSPLDDMTPDMKFYKEIMWMYTEELTTGNKTATGKEFWPKDSLSRQAMAAFIYRLVTDYRK